MQRINVTENSTFLRCEWHHPFIVDRGAAIYILAQPITLNVVECIFESCKVKVYYGAIYAIGVSSVVISDSNFTHCYANEHGADDAGCGGACGLEVSYSIDLTKCFIDQSKSGKGSGGIFIYDSSTESTPTALSSLTFTNNSATTYGGAITLQRMMLNDSVRECLFEGNNAHEGGGIAISATDRLSENVKLVFFCLFIANVAEDGTDAYINDNSTKFTTGSPFECCYSTQTVNHRVFYKGEAEMNKDEWIPSFTTIFIAPDGIDDSLICGVDDSKPCKSLKICVERFSPIISFRLKTGTHSSDFEEIVVDSRTIEIQGESSSTTKIRNSVDNHQDAFFYVKGGSLSFLSLGIIQPISGHLLEIPIFIIRSKSTNQAGTICAVKMISCILSGESEQTVSNPFTRSWFEIIDGNVFLQKVSVSTGIFENVGLFTVSSANAMVEMCASSICSFARKREGNALFSSLAEGFSVECNNCTFKSCKATDSTNGGGMMLQLSFPSQSVRLINSTNIENCSASLTKGRGGGVYLDVLSQMAELRLEAISFISNEAFIGSQLFIKCVDLIEIVNESSFGFARSVSPKENALYGMDSTNFNDDIDIFIFFDGYFSSMIFADQINGKNELYCGKDIRCKTLDYSLDRLKGESGFSLIIRSETSILNEIEMNSHSVASSTPNETAKLFIAHNISGSSKSVIKTSGSLQFNDVQFVLPSSFDLHKYCFLSLESTQSDLRLSSCAFSNCSSESLSYPLLSALFGTITLSACFMTSISFSSSPFYISKDVHLSFDSLCVDTVTQTGCSLVDLSFSNSQSKLHFVNEELVPRIMFKNCYFLNISEEELDASALLSSPISYFIVIDNCSFNSVVSRCSDKGGSLCFSLLEGSSLLVNGTTKANMCSCENLTKGKGGFLYLNSEPADDNFEILDLTFSGNEAFIGRDLFLECKDIARIVNNVTFGFALSIEAIQRANSLIGIDIIRFSDNEDLFYFITGFRNSSIEISSKHGLNNAGCGRSILPCATIDYGCFHLNGEGEQQVLVNEECSHDSEIHLEDISVKSIDSNLASMNVNESISNECGAAITTSSAKFLKILFNVPDSFTNGHAVLLQTTGIEATLDLSECVFKQEAEDELGYNLICVADCSLTMTLCIFSSLNTQTTLVVISSRIECLENEMKSICFNSSIFEKIQGSGNNASSFVFEGEKKYSTIFYNLTLDQCSAELSNYGGGARITLPVESCLEFSDSIVNSCSAVGGKGGGVYLDCLSKDLNPLPFLIANVNFSNNNAFVGRDVFVKCFSIEAQINEFQFKFEMREPPYNRSNAVWGIDSLDHMTDTDLIPFVVIFANELIFVSNSNSLAMDVKNCGSSTNPCQSMNYGLGHVVTSSFSQLLIEDSTVLTNSCIAKSTTIRSLKGVSCATVVLNTSFDNNLFKGIVECCDGIIFERLCFVIGNNFCERVSPLIFLSNETLTVSGCSFSGNERLITLNGTLFEIGAGVFQLMNSKVFSLSTNNAIINIQPKANAAMVTSSFSELIKSQTLIKGEKCNTKLTEVNFQKIETTCLFDFEDSMVQISNCSINELRSEDIPLHFQFSTCANISIEKLEIENVVIESNYLMAANSFSSKIAVNERENYVFSLSLSRFWNISCASVPRLLDVSFRDLSGISFFIQNCTFDKCLKEAEKGEIIYFHDCPEIQINSCTFVGNSLNRGNGTSNEDFERLCRWNTSLINLYNSAANVRDSTVSNSSHGGIFLSGSAMTIEKGEFTENNPFFSGYPSMRRNVACSGSGTVNVVSLKGGDGLERNTSLWMLNEGCSFEGIASERASSFFIPVLESVEAKDATDRMKLIFKGMLLVPCNLSFTVVKRKGEEKEIEHYDFDTSGFLSEREAEGSVAKDLISNCGNEIEVSVSVLFGNAESPSSTQSFILKNASETKQKDDERISEGGKEGKSSWALIVIVIFAVLFLIVLVASIVATIRWRRAKEEAKKYKEIVDDTIKKDPKAFEMVTMEMSPEEQWRRAEREAEKKNDERMKKRIYDTNMEHSESSEHLLSESGSTEYILGRDSDKIPQWALEKVDEEESRKRTPSPSISSTSTTSTTDSDSTFVRSESLCPTTSSMSNLVDAMACSSPHEKLIVDLRDSLFMLLHGRNEKKEMAIGTLKEREMTAAQILFWVANGALHAFEDEEDGLPSLANLSPHIVLFSEHMVICIALHSDCSSDSDSSSVSSLTIVSSSSNISVLSERFTDSPPPSSAFEDEDNFKKECLRWKAPELQMNKKLEATEKSVAFSIGMMLWECLTLTIPFGEYEAVIAGDKIANGERPDLRRLEGNSYENVVRASLSGAAGERPTLSELRREFVGHFGGKAAMVTMSDAIELCGSGEGDESATKSVTNSGENSRMSSRRSGRRSDREARGAAEKGQNEGAV
ncbi:uncharacterized protein MONOS_2898 [Monocercomonoides exilis]|uniref:uncharacterized protein n=1 Tax=Monocercomonoides exilis TaxID=2049356 RepID=UPI00355A6361|nr:hypothetical protein MONOS_2898 [Monocercomonoides exilis]|eukprot:MONOS_2898.1-p1 / transcript=MONOS_2898.1 / gene=MONOS_2898 / organism=Monocercomonoides_exilis_PA203 / gene_product=unspecified product / transcript_product=unspecified product / location=Mono_scaffold00063:62619-69890(-) / protein_length=2401 / sequence_SO=supercontig / SO=protein_coding / is_pseudo=false